MISYTIASHAWGAPAKVLASEGGKHIYNVIASEDIDNCNFVARDAWSSFDLYTMKKATTFEGIVREQAANGNYYVEVTDPGDALFVYTVPIIAEDWTNNFKKESNFYNAQGDVMRCYELAVGDVLEISEAGFTATPTVGDTVELDDYVLVKQ